MALIAIVPPLILATIFDQLLPSLDFSGIITYTLIMFALYIVLYVVSYFQNRFISIAGQRVIRDLRQSVFQKILTFPMQYFEENKRGQLLSMVSSDVNVLSDALTMGIINLVTDTFTIVPTAWIMLVLDWQLGLVVICILPLLLIALRGFREKIHKNFEHIREKLPK